MKKLLIFLNIVSIFGCRTEGDVTPSNESTFIRYFGTQNQNIAVLALETSGGYSLLSNVEFEVSGIQRTKIKFIQTDMFGHTLWEKNFPETGDENWKAASFIETPDAQGNPGYLIVGESIKSNDITELLLFWIDANDREVKHQITRPASGNTLSLHGRAVVKDPADNNFIVLANITSDPAPTSDDMYVFKMSNQDLSVTWTGKYGAGLSSTINRIYPYNNNQNLLWGGSVLNSFSNKSDVRLVLVPKEAVSTETGGPFGDPNFDEKALDFCDSFGGWVFTGSFNKNGTDDIFVVKVTSSGDTIFHTPFATEFNATLFPRTGEQNEKGVSISSTNDGGVVVLGEISTTEKSEDFTIAKLNASGLKAWQYNYGGTDKQEAASIRQTSDGSYLVFGTTYFVNEKKLVLMKLNANGEL